ncbi:MAG: VOC family protein [Gemmatimonadales bacterium]
MSLSHIDHLVYAVPDLARGAAVVGELLGIDPIAGGRHEGFGTANFLVAIGKRCYLEVIGPDPQQPDHAGGRPFGVDLVAEPKLVTWAAKVSNLERRVASVRAAGCDPGSILSMGRSRADGSHLDWRLAVPEATLQGGPLPGDGLVPFLIDWGDSPHPADQMPQACSLLELRAAHPEPDLVQPMLQAFQVDMGVVWAEFPTLTAVIETPQGRVEL